MNSECDQILALLPSLALGTLAPDERERVAAHLPRCDDCRAQASGYEAVVAQLGLGAPRVPPPKALKQRLMQRIETSPGRQAAQPLTWFSRLLAGRPRLVAAGVLAGSALTILLGISNLYLWRQMRTPDPASGLESVNLVHLNPTDAAPEASGTLLMSKDGTWSLLVVKGLPALDAARQYQLWLIDDAKRTSGGVFSVSSHGEAQLKVSSSMPMASYEAFGITIEPRGGSPGPTGEKVLGGRLARTDA